MIMGVSGLQLFCQECSSFVESTGVSHNGARIERCSGTHILSSKITVYHSWTLNLELGLHHSYYLFFSIV